MKREGIYEGNESLTHVKVRHQSGKVSTKKL